MKTYSQFKQDLYEFKGTLNKVNTFMKAKKPLNKLLRLDFARQAIQGKTPIEKGAGVAGAIRPGLLPLAAPSIFNQGKTGSSTYDLMKDIHNVTKKVTKGRIQTNSKTDIGKRLGDVLGFNKKKTMGQNELKGASSGMS